MKARSLQLAVMVVVAWSPAQVCAEGQIEITPFVSTNILYDDNVFRLSDTAEARATLGSDAMGDTSRTLQAGVDVDWKISRQHVRLGYSQNRNRYQRFDFLDNDGYDASAAWVWALGNHLDGELRMSENRAMAGFNEVNNPELNERTTRRKLLSANWNPHPRWRVKVQREETEQTNSLARFFTSDREDRAHEVFLYYNTPAGGQLSFGVRDVDSSYPTRDVFSTVFFGNSNEQRDMTLGAVWPVTGKTRLSGKLARIQRTYAELSQRNIQDWDGRFEWRWRPGEKMQLTVSGERDIYGVDDLAATYVKADTVTIAPTWNPTSKISVQATASHETIRYQGDPGFLLGAQPEREDKIRAIGLVTVYAPLQQLQMKLTFQRQSRDSSTAGKGYDVNSVGLNARLEF